MAKQQTEQRRCDNCGEVLYKPKPKQRFCSNGDKCRGEWHLKHKKSDGILAKVSARRTIKHGHSLTIQISASDIQRLDAVNGNFVRIFDDREQS